jgi:putative peptide zinc metalloprotease protein
VAVPVLIGFVAVCWWVFFEKGLASATYQAFDKPGLLLLVIAVTILSAGFHEFGHAAAARYGGATPGVMGAGVYLIWPAFYTDVTDSYRLGRGGRVRTDLGGLYFNAIVALVTAGVWWATRYDALLLVVATQILQMLRQLTPLVRFDGYHVLADVTGVPDLFHRIKPTLVGLLPWRWRNPDPEARALKPWARAVVTLWVLAVVPVLLFTLAMIVLTLPRVLGTAWLKLQENQTVLAAAWDHGENMESAARIIAMAAVALPIVGSFYILSRVIRRVVASTWRTTSGRPVRRTLAAVTGGLLLAGVAWAWWPGDDNYRPIQPYERGTVADAVSMARPAPAQQSITLLQTGVQRTAYTLWDTSTPLPTRSAPQLALVLVPRPVDSTDAAATAAAEAAPTWVFPFDRPLAPEPGDNQAFAVNTTDGTVVYDAAFALVWAEGEDAEDARNVNEAYAYASCTHCAAVAVGFQVVFTVGDNHVAVPQNLSGALNYDCINCLTYALAQQLFVTLPGPLSDDAMAELDALWQRIADFGARIEAGEVPLSEIQSTLNDFEEQILAIVAADQPGVIPATSSTSSSSVAPSGSPSSGSSGSTGTTDSPTSSGGTTSGGTASGDASPAPSPSEPTSSPSPSPTSSPSDGATGGTTATGE